MRKVVKVILRNEVASVDYVTSEKYYGFVNKFKAKGFVTREKYDDGDYTARAVNAITEGNSWTQHSGNTVKEIIVSMLNAGFTVYEFDSGTELMKFLSKKS